MNDFSLFSGKRVFVTGHTGFKGGWLSVWLNQLGAEVYGYALPPPHGPTNYHLSDVRETLRKETIADIRDRETLSRALRMAKPDVIFHLAAQPLVLEGYRDPFETFDVNVMGTVGLLDVVRSLGRPCAVVCITSDKCYENREQSEGYVESDPMGGYDPYSASKGAAELAISSFRRSFFPPEGLAEHGVQVASVRAGNVIGGGDFAEHRIITDLVDALIADVPLEVRHPQAVRPWQHVLEPLSGYLTLAAKMMADPSPKWCGAWNFGPGPASEKSVREVVNAFIKAWGSGDWIDCSDRDSPHEATLLKLKIDKACQQLGWAPRWTFEETIRRTVEWYKLFKQEGDPAPLTRAQIQAFCGEGASS